MYTQSVTKKNEKSNNAEKLIGHSKEALRPYQYSELKRKEQQFPVTVFFKRQREEPAASPSRDSESPDPALCYYSIPFDILYILYTTGFAVLLFSYYVPHKNTLKLIHTYTYQCTYD